MNNLYKTYLFSYEHAGASWVLEIKAADPDDAMQRIRRIPYAKYDGELMMKIETPSFISALLAKILHFIGRTNPSRQN